MVMWYPDSPRYPKAAIQIGGGIPLAGYQSSTMCAAWCQLRDPGTKASERAPEFRR